MGNAENVVEELRREHRYIKSGIVRTGGYQPEFFFGNGLVFGIIAATTEE